VEAREFLVQLDDDEAENDVSAAMDRCERAATFKNSSKTMDERLPDRAKKMRFLMEDRELMGEGEGKGGKAMGEKGGKSGGGSKGEGGKKGGKIEALAPLKEMAKSRRPCRRLNKRSGGKMPYLKFGKVIACAEIKVKATKQTIRKCLKESIDVSMTESPDTLIDAEKAADVQIDGNETNSTKRQEIIDKADSIIEVLEGMKAERGAEKTSTRFLEERELMGEGGEGKKSGGGEGGKSGKSKKNFSKVDIKAKMKRNIPMKVLDAICEKRCAGTCMRLNRKMSCDCEDSGRTGRWCNRSGKLVTKLAEFCDSISMGQDTKKAECQTSWDTDTQRGMMDVYLKGMQLCSNDRTNMVKNLKNFNGALKKVQESDAPLSSDEIAEKYTTISKYSRDKNWTSDEKMDIDNQKKEIRKKIKPENGNKSEMEQDDEQAFARGDDGATNKAKTDMVGHEIGSEETANAEIYVAPTVYNEGD